MLFHRIQKLKPSFQAQKGPAADKARQRLHMKYQKQEPAMSLLLKDRKHSYK